MVKENTRSLYHHPLVVSNTSLAANGNIIKMHRDLKNIVILEDNSEIEKNIAEIHVLEKNTLQELELIKTNILGDEGNSLEKEARELCIIWGNTKEGVISLVQNKQIDATRKLTNTEGNGYMTHLENKILELNKYAREEAELFMDNTIDFKKLTLLQILSCVFIITSLIIFFPITLKNLMRSIKKLKDTMSDSSISGILSLASIEGEMKFQKWPTLRINLFQPLKRKYVSRITDNPQFYYPSF